MTEAKYNNWKNKELKRNWNSLKNEGTSSKVKIPYKKTCS